MQALSMKAFWSNAAHTPPTDEKGEVTLEQAQAIWSDDLRGAGSFLGLIDSAGNIVQFHQDHPIPDGVDDASHLQLVSLDFPQPGRRGSYARTVSFDEVAGLLAAAFQFGADPTRFEGLEFVEW